MKDKALSVHFLNDGESGERIKSDSASSSPSMKMLKNAEALVMSEIKLKVEVFDVAITEEVVIHTVCIKSGHRQSTKVPLVMVHGFGGGIPAFHKVYGQLAKDRCVYGIDLPGFALSSRVKFSSDATSCENEMVDLIECWRKEMKLKAIILLGHSFGGYISAAYTIRHSNHVHHLVLLDPWGVISRDEDHVQRSRGMLNEILSKFFGIFKSNPYVALQKLGPTIGGHFIRMLMKRIDKEDYGENCVNYFIQAIMTGKPTGANAFSVISDHMFFYSKHPLKKRLIKLLKSVHLPITFIYGKKSTFQNKGGQEIKKASKGKSVNIKYVEGGTHHVHVQNPEKLVKIIRNSVFKDHNRVHKTGKSSKTISNSECLTSCDALLPGAKEGEKIKRDCTMNSGKFANKWEKSICAEDKSDYCYYLARHMFFVLVVALIALVFAWLYVHMTCVTHAGTV